MLKRDAVHTPMVTRVAVAVAVAMSNRVFEILYMLVLAARVLPTNFDPLFCIIQVSFV